VKARLESRPHHRPSESSKIAWSKGDLLNGPKVAWPKLPTNGRQTAVFDRGTLEADWSGLRTDGVTQMDSGIGNFGDRPSRANGRPSAQSGTSNMPLLLLSPLVLLLRCSCCESCY
jgi:hypothetical protein